jgi:recombination protein RecR
MKTPSAYLDSLIEELSTLPGIGRKSASRLAFHMLETRSERIESLVAAMRDVRDRVRFCSLCGGISDAEVCSICSDENRDRTLICVVEHPRDVISIEGTGQYRGLFHVTGGLIAPLDGIGPEDLRLDELRERHQREDISEIILALSPTIEGDATALYILRALEGTGIRITRIAHGLPVGADLEYADAATIARSLEGRREV